MIEESNPQHEHLNLMVQLLDFSSQDDIHRGVVSEYDAEYELVCAMLMGCIVLMYCVPRSPFLLFCVSMTVVFFFFLYQSTVLSSVLVETGIPFSPPSFVF